jgi:hypothetical protein
MLGKSGRDWLGWETIEITHSCFLLFFFLFSLLTTISLFLKLSLRHGYRDMMHIKQARERPGSTVWAGQGENWERVFWFWVWDFCVLLPFIHLTAERE